MWKAIELAYKKGYRVTDNGLLIGLNGRPLSVKLRGNQRYPTFSVSGVDGIKNKYGVFGIPVHKYAAYCFYGDEARNSECVRHLNGNALDFSKENIALGTHQQNEYDKAAEIRSNSARKARAAQGYRAKNSKFNTDQVKYIRSSHPAKSYREIAEEFNVTPQCIFLIVKRKNYSDIT
jgi:hypothetical protein